MKKQILRVYGFFLKNRYLQKQENKASFKWW